MKLSARNVLKGTVLKIIPGAVNREVILEVAGGAQVVSIISKDAVADLGLTAGMTASRSTLHAPHPSPQWPTLA